MKIIGASVYQQDYHFHPCNVTVTGDRITRIGPSSERDALGLANETVINAEGKYLIPGLIDVHMHGWGGVGCDQADPEKLKTIGRRLAQEGVTGYACTLASEPDEHAFAAIAANLSMARQEEKKRTGARMLGFHMEGPFLNPVKKGGMTLEYLQKPSVDLLKQFIEASSFQVKIMTIAPEIKGALDVIRYGASKGIKMSIGHTMATSEEAERGIEAGASRATHTFNAMAPFDHRKPGVLGTVLTDDRVQCEMISDLVHLNFRTCRLIYRAKGPDKVTLITDSDLLAGLKQEEIPKEYPVIMKDAAYLPNGTLCGSIISLMKGMQNMVSIGIPLEDAVRMASYNPARDLGVEKDYGSIDVGKAADMVILNKDLSVDSVFVGGTKLR